MASASHSTGAQLLQFTGEWEGRFVPTPYTLNVRLSAVNDAHHIVAAKKAADNWMTSLLVCIVSVMDKDDACKIGLMLDCMSGEGAEQAAALVRLHTGSKEHKRHVAAALGAMGQLL